MTPNIEHEAEIQRRDNEIATLKLEIKLRDKEIQRLQDKLDYIVPLLNTAQYLLKLLK